MTLLACATRPVNQPVPGPVAQDASFQRFYAEHADSKTLVILAFSGGGSRAASFSYGVLETLRDTEIQSPSGQSDRLLDYVDVITGVSGGAFTALAYRLYGESLFDIYEQAFLKRNIQGELISGAFNPLNWSDFGSDGLASSEMAANLYDKVLFKGATFSDFSKTSGPMVVVSATDIETGSRILFSESNFNALCTDLMSFRVARAAAASSAVPILLAPVTIDNYAGSCDLQSPAWFSNFKDKRHLPRSAAKVFARVNQIERLDRVNNPYLHLVDGGVSDNVSLRSVMDFFYFVEAAKDAGYKTKLDKFEKIVVFAVNSETAPKLNWNKREAGPGLIPLMIQSAGVPIDANSSEQLTDLRDISTSWRQMNEIKRTPQFKKLLKQYPDLAAVKQINGTPHTEIYVVNVAFSEINDKEERNYLNNLPTSFALEPEQVDRLKSSARQIVLQSPEFKRLINDLKATIHSQ
ncbi:MAG: patatin-like phospholipase family protein [Fluviibacter sp.]